MAGVTLFLDFDGVLHPAFCPEEEHFCRRPLLEAVLRRHPAVEVVISSSWRHHHALEDLLSRFSGDIAARIVGATRPWRQGGPANRHAEILDWLAWQRREGLPWLALDDSAFEFPGDCANLLLCDSRFGLTETLAETLSRRLSSMAEGRGGGERGIFRHREDAEKP
ncbi:MAG TPA: HAD domain-containing protein [Candidatus Desulfobacillus sp.]|mgnify:CR=1 FL=1|nr:HAD domain-containing protein [Candidatus Desulfobacillus sp.]